MKIEALFPLAKPLTLQDLFERLEAMPSEKRAQQELVFLDPNSGAVGYVAGYAAPVVGSKLPTPAELKKRSEEALTNGPLVFMLGRELSFPEMAKTFGLPSDGCGDPNCPGCGAGGAQAPAGTFSANQFGDPVGEA